MTMAGHTANANQLAQLATLRAAQATARTTLQNAQAALATAQKAQIAADNAVVAYQAWVNGTGPYPGTTDPGSPEVV